MKKTTSRSKRGLELTDRQIEGARRLGGPARNVMLYGGSRSGKTFLVCWRMAHNANSIPGSRQAILRRHLVSVRTSVGMDTMPKVLRMERIPATFHRSDQIFRFPNGSEIWLVGLDDKERVEKILGKEFCTMYFNECSEIAWQSILVARSRCAMKVRDAFGRPRRNRFYFDCNPPSKRHWCYKAFVLKQDPVKNTPWRDPGQWDYLQMNPMDNRAHLQREYIDGVLGEYVGVMRKRFLEGVFADQVENALWTPAMIDRRRASRERIDPDLFERIVIGIDPAVTDAARSDMTGIVVAGRSGDTFYILEDLSCRTSPGQWARIAVEAYHRYRADKIVAETNQGGDLVLDNIRHVDSTVAVSGIRAKKGKRVRAEPVANLYEQGRVVHCGEFPELEDQMTGYVGPDARASSPDAMDAMVYAVLELARYGEMEIGDFSY